METKEGELKAFLAAHTAMDNHPEAGNAGGRRERGGVAAIPALTIPPVSAAPTQGSSATAHREASSPGEGVSPSADSELVANATDYCASPRGNDIRGSSWAMVAASGSRTTSTHPSTTSMSEEGSRPPVVLHLVEPSLDAPDGRADFKTALSSDSLLFISQVPVRCVLCLIFDHKLTRIILSESYSFTASWTRCVKNSRSAESTWKPCTSSSSTRKKKR